MHLDSSLNVPKEDIQVLPDEPPTSTIVCYFTNADQKDLENSESGPAMDKECLKCGKRNHFIAKCKSKGVREAGLDDGESNEMYQTDVAAVNNWPP